VLVPFHEPKEIPTVEELPGDDPGTSALRIRFKDGRTDRIAGAPKELEMEAGQHTGRDVAPWTRTGSTGTITDAIPQQPKPRTTKPLAIS